MAHGILTLLAALTYGLIGLLDPDVLRDDPAAPRIVRPAEMPGLGPVPDLAPMPGADPSDLIEA